MNGRSMDCSNCEYRIGNLCREFDERLKISGVEGEVVEFERLKDCLNNKGRNSIKATW